MQANHITGLHKFRPIRGQCANSKLTAGNLEPTVDKDGVAGGVLGPDDPAPLHDHLRIQGPPHTGTTLLYTTQCIVR